MVRLSVCVSIPLLFASMAFAQDARSGAVRPRPASASTHAVQVAGRVSADGKTLISDDQDHWTISNPRTLQGRENQWVIVKCQLSSDQSSIHVFSLTSGQASASVRYSDAAFRR